jgi:hypothetical protein
VLSCRIAAREYAFERFAEVGGGFGRFVSDAFVSKFSFGIAISTPTVTPPNLTVNQPIQVTASCKIYTSPGDPALLAEGVNLVRLTATGAAASIVGLMHDDGLNGDATAGDGVFTYQYTDTESAADSFNSSARRPFKESSSGSARPP